MQHVEDMMTEKKRQLLDWAFMIMADHPPLQQQSQEFIVIIVLMMH